ncbi:MAG: phosphatidylinositol-3-phosphate phosphatase [Mycobacterium sp.]|nr:phosphatidylinositol-3-phosphate phosphatase [Mycobacterium sp.]
MRTASFHRLWPTLAAAVAALLLAACSGGQRVPSVLPSGPATATSGSAVTKVLTVVFENHGEQAALDGMSYLAGLARTYGQSADYRGVAHPSLPNYLAIAGGSTFGVGDDADPSAHRLTGPSVFDTAVAAGRTAAVYAEAMPGTCAPTAAGRYAVKHNPWPYFADPASAANCQAHDVPAGTPASGALAADIAAGRLPTVGLLVPDLCNDAHDCSLATADTWLRGWMTSLLAGPDWASGHLAVVLTFDEGTDSPTGPLLTVVASPRLHGVVAQPAVDHLSLCRWLTDLVGAAPLRQAAGSTSLGAAFGL